MWASAILKKRNHIIAAVIKRRLAEKDFQFGNQVPRNVTETIAVDREKTIHSGRMQLRKRWMRDRVQDFVVLPVAMRLMRRRR